jgi:hypothetical protein
MRNFAKQQQNTVHMGRQAIAEVEFMSIAFVTKVSYWPVGKL